MGRWKKTNIVERNFMLCGICLHQLNNISKLHLHFPSAKKKREHIFYFYIFITEYFFFLLTPQPHNMYNIFLMFSLKICFFFTIWAQFFRPSDNDWKHALLQLLRLLMFFLAHVQIFKFKFVKTTQKHREWITSSHNNNNYKNNNNNNTIRNNNKNLNIVLRCLYFTKIGITLAHRGIYKKFCYKLLFYNYIFLNICGHREYTIMDTVVFVSIMKRSEEEKAVNVYKF